jgi:hypothetical protein
MTEQTDAQLARITGLRGQAEQMQQQLMRAEVRRDEAMATIGSLQDEITAAFPDVTSLEQARARLLQLEQTEAAEIMAVEQQLAAAGGSR